MAMATDETISPYAPTSSGGKSRANTITSTNLLRSVRPRRPALATDDESPPDRPLIKAVVVECFGGICPAAPPKRNANRREGARPSARTQDRPARALRRVREHD